MPQPNPFSLNYGRQLTALPGPSVVPERVLEAFSRAMPDLYEGPIIDTNENVRAQLPGLAKQQGGAAFIISGNGHSAWQMATSNTLARGDKVVVCDSGLFPKMWGEYTAVSELEVLSVPGNMRDPVDVAGLQALLEEDRNHEIKAVLCAHVDTASSVRNDVVAIRKAIDEAQHPALFMVDCIASMGCERFEMTNWGVDIAISCTQKGLMVPPGLAILWASEKALAAHERADMRVGYLDWETRLNDVSQYNYFAGTPPIAHMRGLEAAFELISEEGGIEAVWRRHEIHANAVRAAIGEWAKTEEVEFNIKLAENRSNAVTTVLCPNMDYESIRAVCNEHSGLILGLGIAGTRGFRIAHMGHHNPPMILGALATIEAALIAHGLELESSGVAAAVGVIADSMVEFKSAQG